MAQHIYLIGFPLKHSISPDFQQAALDYYKLDVRYELLETNEESLPAVIGKLRQLQNLGANVTVPYKEKVLGLLDEVDAQANLIGAVNVIVNRGSRLTGFNTDAYGFIQALCTDGEFNPRKKCALLLGAGGVARAAGFALVQEELASLMITNRTLLRAQELAKALTKHISDKKLNTKVIVVPWSLSELHKAMKECHLMVNCTTMGMRHSAQENQSPLEANVIPRDALVYDLVYNPSETPLLKLAAGAGARILGGLPMLVYQGAAAFELWTGRKAPVDIMFSTARAVLSRP